jgi:RNA polymerase sigma factor (sigma-70 family)
VNYFLAIIEHHVRAEFERRKMLSNEEAQNLMGTLITLRSKANETKSPKDIQAFKRHESLCIEKFQYLITMKTNRYKNFSNWEDLNQEGFEALLKAMKNYDPKKGSWFWWAHKYIGTRISRCANLHTTIRYPLRVAKETTPHKESVMPLLIEDRYCPDKEIEASELHQSIYDTLPLLTKDQQEIVCLAYGLDGDKPLSMNKISRKLGLSRLNCLKLLDTALSTMRDNIKT